jgi:hypothetical protein
LELNRLKKVKNGVNFVSRTKENNGVSAVVEAIPEKAPYNPGLITVAMGGSILESFIQPNKFYTGRDVVILTPKRTMTLNEKIYYCMCIRANKYKYSYGRQANRTINDIPIPIELPSWVYETKNLDLDHMNKEWSATQDNLDLKTELNISKWKAFRYDELFEIKKGKRITNNQMRPGKTPCIRPIDSNNGVYSYIDINPNHAENTITVNYNGSVGETFYQPIPYFALDDVNVLYPKFDLNPFIALFLITLIKKEKYRYNYGRKWHLKRMEQSIINLPVTEDGIPDWEFMETFIKGLPYSKCLVAVNEVESITEINGNVQQTFKLQKTLTDF